MALAAARRRWSSPGSEQVVCVRAFDLRDGLVWARRSTQILPLALGSEAGLPVDAPDHPRLVVSDAARCTGVDDHAPCAHRTP